MTAVPAAAELVATCVANRGSGAWALRPPLRRGGESRTAVSGGPGFSAGRSTGSWAQPPQRRLFVHGYGGTPSGVFFAASLATENGGLRKLMAFARRSG